MPTGDSEETLPYIGKDDATLPGSRPRPIEQEEFLFIQARRIKAYTGKGRDPLSEFPITNDRDEKIASAAQWTEPDDQLGRKLVGLALSGGGIRSATFGLAAR